MCSRYTGFGLDFIAALKSSLPSAFDALSFYRAAKHQHSDVYAVCRWTQTTFAIQLDPDCEVICLWDGSTHIEIGTWESSPSSAAIDFIRDNFANGASP